MTTNREEIMGRTPTLNEKLAATMCPRESGGPCRDCLARAEALLPLIREHAAMVARQQDDKWASNPGTYVSAIEDAARALEKME